MTMFVYSTMTSDVGYTRYSQVKGSVPCAQGVVFIKGGTGLATKQLVTPLGICTQITDEEYAELVLNPVFKLHEKNGFIKVEKGEMAIEKAVADLNPRDKSAPITPKNINPNDEVQPYTGKGKK